MLLRPQEREETLRSQMVEILRLMYAYRYIVAGDGNVSVRLNDREFLITPSGVAKGYLKPEDMVVMDREGKRTRQGRYRPSSEYRVHLEVYKTRPDVHAVVHAHPRHCIAFSLAGVTLAQCLIPEVVITLGSIPITPYVTPTSQEGATIIRDWIKDYNAVILNRHGSVTVGKDLWEAYNRLEIIEHTAEITHFARQLGPVQPLPTAEIEKLSGLAAMFGLKPKIQDPCEICNACPNSKIKKESAPASLTEVLKRLKRDLETPAPVEAAGYTGQVS